MASSGENTLPAKRRAELVRLVREHGQKTVAELAATFDVSPDTIRRDLDLLAERKHLVRSHGGAVSADLMKTTEAPFVRRLGSHAGSKSNIAQAAVQFVSDSATILLNGGTTTLAIARALTGRRDLTIVTNNLRIPSELPPDAVRELYLLGGLIAPAGQVTLGPVSFPGAHAISADIAFLGVGGISATGGLSTTSLTEARMISEMIDAAAQVVVVADATKFGREAFIHIAELSRISALITDDTPPAPLAEALAAAGVDVLTA